MEFSTLTHKIPVDIYPLYTFIESLPAMETPNDLLMTALLDKFILQHVTEESHTLIENNMFDDELDRAQDIIHDTVHRTINQFDYVSTVSYVINSMFCVLTIQCHPESLE